MWREVCVCVCVCVCSCSRAIERARAHVWVGGCRVCGSGRERARAHIVKEVEDRSTPCNTIKLAPFPQVFNNKLGHQFGGAPLTHGSRMLGYIHLWRLTTGQEPGRPSPGLQRCSCPTKPAIHLDGVRGGVRRCLMNGTVNYLKGYVFC